MGLLVWIMTAIALWHFTIFLPDRWWSGIVGAFVGAVVRRIPKRPFNTAEATRQAWVIMRVIIIPTALVSIPLGAVVALQIGSLTQQLGAQSFAGAASVVAIVREGALHNACMRSAASTYESIQPPTFRIGTSIAS